MTYDGNVDARFVKLSLSDFEDMIFPELGNLTDSKAQAFGLLLVYNDVQGGSNASANRRNAASNIEPISRPSMRLRNS